MGVVKNDASNRFGSNDRWKCNMVKNATGEIDGNIVNE